MWMPRTRMIRNQSPSWNRAILGQTFVPIPCFRGEAKFDSTKREAKRVRTGQTMVQVTICVFPRKEWCAREDLNLQTAHSLACRSVVFRCHSLPIQLQQYNNDCKLFLASIGKYRQRLPCKICASPHRVQKVCKAKISPHNLCKSCANFCGGIRAGLNATPAADVSGEPFNSTAG